MTRFLNVLERSAWTFCQSFAASVVLTNGLNWTDVKIALGAAVLSVLKNLSLDVRVQTVVEEAAVKSVTRQGVTTTRRKS